MDTSRKTDPMTGKILPVGVIICASCGGWLRQASAHETVSRYGTSSFHHFRCISRRVAQARPHRQRRSGWSR